MLGVGKEWTGDKRHRFPLPADSAASDSMLSSTLPSHTERADALSTRELGPRSRRVSKTLKERYSNLSVGAGLTPA